MTRYTPDTAQRIAHEVVCCIGLSIDPVTPIMLTDTDDTGPVTSEHGHTMHLLNASQIIYAARQHQNITGDEIDATALADALPLNY